MGKFRKAGHPRGPDLIRQNYQHTDQHVAHQDRADAARDVILAARVRSAHKRTDDTRGTCKLQAYARVSRVSACQGKSVQWRSTLATWPSVTSTLASLLGEEYWQERQGTSIDAEAFRLLQVDAENNAIVWSARRLVADQTRKRRAIG